MIDKSGTTKQTVYKIRDALDSNRIVKRYKDKKRAESFCQKSVYYWIMEDVAITYCGGD